MRLFKITALLGFVFAFTSSIANAALVLEVTRSGIYPPKENRNARLLENGTLQCGHWDTDSKSFLNDTEFQAAVPPTLIQEIKERGIKLAKLFSDQKKWIDKTSCFDGPSLTYSTTGSPQKSSFNFFNKSLDCKESYSHINSTDAHYLKGFADALWSRCLEPKI
jgi:hypothetical protein